MALTFVAVALALAVADAVTDAGAALRAIAPPPSFVQDTAKKSKGHKASGEVVDSTAHVDSAPPTSKNEMPSPEKLAERKLEADALPLFRDRAPLEFTLIANFKRLAKERDTLSTRRFAGTVIVAGEGGRVDTIPVKLRTRGHYRLARCSFVPLRVEFPGKASKGTPFEHEDALKLGTHCERSGEYEQYVLREYLAYRIHELVSPIGFRARLARATYVDSASAKPIDTRFALFLESEEHMAARAGGVVRPLRGALFEDVDSTALLNMTVFNYMIGGHDWSMYALHNVRLVVQPTGTLLPVPYDFDFSGLVETRYAIPDPRLGIRSVRARLNRGPCRTREQLEPTLARFRSVRSQVLALYDSLPGLDKRYAGDAKRYLGDFFDTIERPGLVKAALVDVCSRKESA